MYKTPKRSGDNDMPFYSPAVLSALQNAVQAPGDKLSEHIVWSYDFRDGNQERVIMEPLEDAHKFI